MPYSQPVVTLLEGKWFPDKHVTVSDLFNPLFSVWTPSGKRAYHYEMFTNEHAFVSAIAHAMRPGKAHAIYIGAHGDEKCIHGFHDEGISRTKIRNAFSSKRGPKHGVYFGSCLFATPENAEYLLESCPRITWMAGYTSSVDWIDSSALDLIFLRHFLFPSPGSGTKKPTTSYQRLRYAVDRVKTDMQPFVRRLEFHVYVRSPGKGPIKDLIAEG